MLGFSLIFSQSAPSPHLSPFLPRKHCEFSGVQLHKHKKTKQMTMARQRQVSGDEMEDLANQVKALKVTEIVRRNKRLNLPPPELVLEFDRLACELSNRKFGGSAKVRSRRIKSAFGIPPIVMAKCWELFVIEEPLPSGAKKVQFLWALNFLKEYRTENNAAGSFKVDEKTYRKWVSFFVEELSNLTPVVIRWENRFTNDKGADCLASVDGTDLPFPQIKVPNPEKPGKKMMNKALYSKKFNGPGLRYEVALSLLSNDIVNIEGPFCPGDFNDVSIFRKSLKHMLEEGERCEADDGYVGEAPEYIICPQSFTNDEGKAAIQKRIQGRHELMNRRIKHFNCLVEKFKLKGTMEEKVSKHSNLFRCCTVLTQIGLEMGVGELYDIEDGGEVY